MSAGFHAETICRREAGLSLLLLAANLVIALLYVRLLRRRGAAV